MVAVAPIAAGRTVDSAQDAVICADPSARLLVEAGPGTGKTAVACARVGHLVRNGIEPTNVLLVSFTRTAVREMRDRIAGYLSDPRDAAAIRISTIDSFSWRFWTGFLREEIEDPFAGYERTIDEARRMLQERHPDLVEYLAPLRHVLIDEAQDLTGSRLSLLQEFISCLVSDCGVTVFADPAQAIYGFTLRDEEGVHADEDLTAEPVWLTFRRIQLARVHRTQERSLLTLWAEARPFLLTEEGFTAYERYTAVDALVRSLATEAVSDSLDHTADLNLFRWRASALEASKQLSLGGKMHRLRMSDLPACIAPWVGVCFANDPDRFVNLDAFSRLWASVPSVLQDRGGIEGCWRALLQTARAPGRSGIDLEKLRSALSRQRPPLELSLSEFGLSGPIISTIHASKGREAEAVRVFLPDPESLDLADDLREEARVLYVAATRARERFIVSPGNRRSGFFNEAAKRICRRKWTGTCASVEFGRRGDVDCELADLEQFGTASFIEGQHWLATWDAARPEPAWLVAHPDKAFRYALTVNHRNESSGPVVAVLGLTINAQLFDLARDLFQTQTLRPSMRIGPVFILGVRTVAFAPGDPRLQFLPEPHKNSGFALAPIWSGYPDVFFKSWQ